MKDDIAIEVSGLSKKFSTSLKRAMVYGLSDISRAALPASRAKAAKQGLSKQAELRKGEFWAIQDVSFTIKKGERVGIIGHNGAGKSTLFTLLSGIYGPTLGHIKLQGRLQALIALGAGFHPMLSGRENVYINAAILGLGKEEIQKKMDHIISFADIDGFIDAPVKNYSSGMLVRLGFAIAAHMDPEIMLIDEVLAVGDADFQSKCVGFTQRLADEGRTIVMVSHQLPQILRVCERVIWMDHGKIVMDGKAQEVVRAYSAHTMQESYAKRDAIDTGVAASNAMEFTYEVLGEKEAAGTDKDGLKLPVVMHGEDLSIQLQYKLKTGISGQLSFWVHVKDAISGQRIFGKAGWQVKTLVDGQAAPEGKLLITFENIPLCEGVYNVDIGVTDFTRAGESHGLASAQERDPSFMVIVPQEKFVTPFRAAADNRTPLIDWNMKIEQQNG